jgi:hypothetical protein
MLRLWDTAKVEITLRNARHAGKRRSASPSRRTRRRRRNNGRCNGVASKHSAARAASYCLALISEVIGKIGPDVYRIRSLSALIKRITAHCRDEIALRRARRRKSVGGCRVAESWPLPRTAEKAHNGASPLYGARGKVRRFALM